MTGVLHVVIAMKPVEDGFAENAMKHGVAGLNIDGCRIEASQEDREIIDNRSGKSHVIDGWGNIGGGWKEQDGYRFKLPVSGRWPANVILDDSKEVTRAFPETTSGNRNGKHIAGWKDSGGTWYGPNDTGHSFVGDSGSAARFFKQIKEYEDETSGREQDEGC